MGLILCFLFGITNFSCHRAVMESKHPFVEDTKLYFGQHIGKYAGYIFEFIILLGALVYNESFIFVLIYMTYTALNITTAYLLLNNKL